MKAAKKKRKSRLVGHLARLAVDPRKTTIGSFSGLKAHLTSHQLVLKKDDYPLVPTASDAESVVSVEGKISLHGSSSRDNSSVSSAASSYAISLSDRSALSDEFATRPRKAAAKTLKRRRKTVFKWVADTSKQYCRAAEKASVNGMGALIEAQTPPSAESDATQWPNDEGGEKARDDLGQTLILHQSAHSWPARRRITFRPSGSTK